MRRHRLCPGAACCPSGPWPHRYRAPGRCWRFWRAAYSSRPPVSGRPHSVSVPDPAQLAGGTHRSETHDALAWATPGLDTWCMRQHMQRVADQCSGPGPHTLLLNPVSHALYMQGQIVGTHLNFSLIVMGLAFLTLLVCAMSLGYAFRLPAQQP